LRSLRTACDIESRGRKGSLHRGTLTAWVRELSLLRLAHVAGSCAPVLDRGSPEHHRNTLSLLLLDFHRQLGSACAEASSDSGRREGPMHEAFRSSSPISRAP